MHALCGDRTDKEILKAELKGGTKIGEVTICESFLFHRYFFRTVYIRYVDIAKAYLRVEFSESGDFGVEENSLVLVDVSQREHKLHLDNRKYVEEILDILKEKFVHIKIGKNA